MRTYHIPAVVHYHSEVDACGFCGWAREEWYYEDGVLSEGGEVEDVLREFDLSSAEVSLDELGTFLRNHYRAVLSLSPRRLELLVADAFKNLGFEVEVTRPTHDGGRDLVLLSSGAEQAIVEIKRYRANVGVDLVRQLRGVQLREGTGKAVLVTTGRFTSTARKEAAAEIPHRMGFEMELMDADDLLRLLSVYNEHVYSLAEVDRMRRDFAEANRDPFDAE